MDQEQKENPFDYVAQPPMHAARSRAKVFLHTGSNRLGAMLALLISTVLGFVPIPVFSIAGSLFPFWNEEDPVLNSVVLIAYGGILLFWLFPLLFGFLRYMDDMRRGETPTLKTVFYAFTAPRRYGAAVLFSLIRILHLAAIMAVIVFSVAGLGIGAVGALLIGLALVMMVFGLFFGVSVEQFRNDCAHPLSTVIGCVRRNGKRIPDVFGFRMNFVGTVLLSLVTFGVYGLVHGVPYMILSYGYYYTKTEGLT